MQAVAGAKVVMQEEMGMMKEKKRKRIMREIQMQEWQWRKSMPVVVLLLLRVLLILLVVVNKRVLWQIIHISSFSRFLLDVKLRLICQKYLHIARSHRDYFSGARQTEMHKKYFHFLP